jgi:hypothetical protein
VKHSCSATARVGVSLSKVSKSLNGICEFHPEASTFQALPLEIPFQFRINELHLQRVGTPVFPIATGFDQLLKYVCGIIRHCFSRSHNRDDSEVCGAVSTRQDLEGT